MGRIATILFAHKLGTSLEPECKMYRLAADVFNDTAMVLDCLSPALPKGPRVLLLSFSSVLRALCGVAAGSSKASLSAHFAKWGNLGELNAVGSSQIAFYRSYQISSVKSSLLIATGSIIRLSSSVRFWFWFCTLASRLSFCYRPCVPYKRRHGMHTLPFAWFFRFCRLCLCGL